MRLIVKLIQYIQFSLIIQALEGEIVKQGYLHFRLEQSMYQDDHWTHEDLPQIYADLAKYQKRVEELDNTLSLFVHRRHRLFSRLNENQS